jgi:carbon monoxide dehydrogenase subunit G
MDMTGEYRIPAPRDTVWAALNDPEILRQAIPGCQSLERVSDHELAAKVRAKIGPVAANFAGKVTLSDLDPPTSYRISGEGSGGVAGFAKGAAEVRLAEDGPEATVLRYSAKAEVGGKLAQIGSRLVQGTAKKMADEFFGTFSRLVAGATPAAAVTAAAAAQPAFAEQAERAEPREAEITAARAAEAVGPSAPVAGIAAHAAADATARRAAPPPPPPAPAPAPSRTWWLIGAVAVLVLLALLFSR